MKDAYRPERQVSLEVFRDLEKRPEYSTVVNLRDVRTNERVFRQLMRATVLENNSVQTIGTTNNGKSTMTKELKQAHDEACEILGIQKEATKQFSWGKFRRDAIEMYGPMNTWEQVEQFSIPDEMTQQAILDGYEYQQFNDYNALGYYKQDFNRGVGTAYLTAQLNRIAQEMEPPIIGSSHPAFRDGKKSIFLAPIPNFPFGEWAEKPRNVARTTPEGESIVKAIKDRLNIDIRGAKDTPEYEAKLREWAKVSASASALQVNKVEFQEQVTEWIETTPMAIHIVDSIKVPKEMEKFLNLVYPGDVFMNETRLHEYQLNVAYMIHFLRDMLHVPEKDMFPVHNIPVIKEGRLIMPSPV